jgi:hypothetical protein
MVKMIVRFVFWVVILVLVAVLGAVLLFVGQGQGLFNFGVPTYQNRAVVVLESVQQLSTLTTTRYNFSSVVTSERDMPDLLDVLYGERLVLIAVGHVTAGVDLSVLTQDDLSLADGTLTLRLPAPMLQDCFLNEGSSYVVSRDTGIFNRAAPNLDTEARRFAIAQFLADAQEQGVLEQAQAHARVAIEQFLRALQIDGVTTVNIVSTPPDPNAPLPSTCQ